MKYFGNILIEGAFAHNYYQDGKAKGLSLRPWPETADFIEAHWLQLKSQKNGFRVTYLSRTAGNPPPVQLNPGDYLIFDLISPDGKFHIYTQRQPYDLKNQVFLYQNVHEIKNLEEELVAMTGGLYSYPLVTSGSINLKILNPAGVELISRSTNGPTETIDLSNFEDGVFFIEEWQGNNLVHRTPIIRRRRRRPPYLIGTVMIRMVEEDTFSYQNATELAIQFTARTRPWEYKIIVGQDPDPVYYHIEDAEVDPQPPYTKLNFQLVSDESPVDYTERKLLFRTIEENNPNTPQAIQDYEQPKRKLELVRYLPRTNSNPDPANGFNSTDYDREVIYRNLPNPSLEGKPSICLYQK